MSQRPIFGRRTFSSRGRIQVDITCPRCGRTYTVYEWSFAGVGKQCECGVKLGWMGVYDPRPKVSA